MKENQKEEKHPEKVINISVIDPFRYDIPKFLPFILRWLLAQILLNPFRRTVSVYIYMD